MKRIALDGPAGAMYRAVALFFLDEGVKDSEDSRIESLLEKLDISIKYEDGTQKVFLNGVDVSDKLRLEQIGKLASKFSAIGSVREKLVALQRKLAKKENVVMDGRDIGTVVLPNADLKIYLSASSKVRAKRRYLELLEKGNTDLDINLIEDEIIKRDEADMNREISPLKQAEDAYYLDSSDMTLEEVVSKILSMVEEEK